MINQIKNFDADRYDLEGLVELSATARALRSEFTALSVEVPEWLENQARAIQNAIKAKTNDILAKKLREAKLQREGLKTTQEKRDSLDVTISKLEALVNS